MTGQVSSKKLIKMRVQVVTGGIIVFLGFLVSSSYAIRCYQCSSDDEKGKGIDTCGVYNKFDKDYHIPVECQGDESHTPGTFCMKATQQSPRGFIWDGRWRQVVRRCASVTDTGVTGVCNWGVYENGVYWEECYCSTDGCNSGMSLTQNLKLFVIALFSVFIFNFH